MSRTCLPLPRGGEGRGEGILVVAVALVLLAGCRTIPKTPDAILRALAVAPDAYLSGQPIALRDRLVLNREDFVYDAKLSPDSKFAAISRLGPKSFHLALHDLTTPGKPRSDTAVNPLEFDVDEVEFSPDGTRVATVSRDGALRIYAAKTGALEAAWLTEEPLVSVGWHPSGELIALGSAKGLVTLVSVAQMQHVAELRAHTDEVRAVVFTPAGDLVTGSWDRRMLIFRVSGMAAQRLLTASGLDEQVQRFLDQNRGLDAQQVTGTASPAVTWTTRSTGHPEVRAHVTKKNGLVLFRAVLDRSVSATVALDTRVPMIVVKSALAQAVGIDALKLTDTVMIATAFGNQLAKVAKGRVLSIKNLTFERVDVAVCDACVPADAQAVLGGPVLQQVSTAFDESTSELVFTLNEGASGVSLGSARTMTLAREFTFPASVNDVSLDAKGLVAGVAFSETKSQRTKAVYDREKKKELEPEREWDCGARVDLISGEVLEKKSGHHGVVASVGISPDGKTLATGGWDKKVILHGEPLAIDADYGWAVRRVRFSRDGRKLVVAAWTPQNPLNDHQSDPSAVVYEVVYAEASVTAREPPRP